MSDKLSLLPKMGVWLWGYAGGLMRLTILPRPDHCRVDIASVCAPSKALALAVEEAFIDQSPALVGHCWRTYLIGMALAKLDGCTLDPDSFFAAALLHDYGLAHPSGVGDFTLDGAACAMRCATKAGLEPEKAIAIADAICTHATIGITPEKDGPLGCYVQWAAMADLAGLRRWELGRGNLRKIRDQCGYPGGFKSDCILSVKGEAHRFPSGRFALYRKLGINVMVRLAPLIPTGG